MRYAPEFGCISRSIRSFIRGAAFRRTRLLRLVSVESHQLYLLPSHLWCILTEDDVDSYPEGEILDTYPEDEVANTDPEGRTSGILTHLRTNQGQAMNPRRMNHRPQADA